MVTLLGREEATAHLHILRMLHYCILAYFADFAFFVYFAYFALDQLGKGGGYQKRLLPSSGRRPAWVFITMITMIIGSSDHLII